MKARDIMTSPVITVAETAVVKDAAKQLVERRISALPVVDQGGQLVGIISEADLLHRMEIETDRQTSGWLTFLAGDDERLAAEYIKAHSLKIADVMTRNVITAKPDTSLTEIARAMDQNRIKRIPIVLNGQIVGVVSRSDLVRAIARGGIRLEIPLSDAAIREKLLAHLREQWWAHTDSVNIAINKGIIDVSGTTNSETERKALLVAAECIPGVRGVNDRLSVEKRKGTSSRSANNRTKSHGTFA